MQYEVMLYVYLEGNSEFNAILHGCVVMSLVARVLYVRKITYFRLLKVWAYVS